MLTPRTEVLAIGSDLEDLLHSSAIQAISKEVIEEDEEDLDIPSEDDPDFDELDDDEEYEDEDEYFDDDDFDYIDEPDEAYEDVEEIDESYDDVEEDIEYEEVIPDEELETVA